jgi:hypothetical protein
MVAEHVHGRESGVSTQLKLGPLLRDSPVDGGAGRQTIRLEELVKNETATSGDNSRRKSRTYVLLGLVGVLGAAALMVPIFESLKPIPSSLWAKQSEIGQPALPGSSLGYSQPVQQLMRYIVDLRHGKVAFDGGISGEQAAEQLGYSRLFASDYQEVSLRAKASERAQRPFGLADVITAFEDIVREEQAIDKLLVGGGRYATAIAYLRALQNGDVSFPAPQPMAPTPPVLLSELTAAYPKLHIDVRDPTFAQVYRGTRVVAAALLQQKGKIYAQEVIAEFRREIARSAAGN